MKRIKLSFLAIFAVIASALMLSACSTPADYCENVMGKCTKLEKDVNKLADQIASKDIDKIQIVYNENLAEINETIDYLQKIGACNNQEYLQKAALNFAQTYKDIYENEYATAIDILKKDKKTFEDGDKIAFMFDDVEAKSNEAKIDLLNNFKKFIQEFELTVAQ